MRRLRLVVPQEDAGERIDRFIAARGGISRGLARRALDAGGVFLDGRRCKVSGRTLHPGQQVVVNLEEGGRAATAGGGLERSRLLHVDPELVAVDKPPGVPAQPTLTSDRGALPELVLRPEPMEAPNPEEEPKAAPESAWWLLSLFSPQEAESVDWSRGNYSILSRGGRVESDSSNGALKKQSRMVAEGSVLLAGVSPSGAAQDVAPEGVEHPVYRAGFALAVPIPWREVAR